MELRAIHHRPGLSKEELVSDKYPKIKETHDVKPKSIGSG